MGKPAGLRCGEALVLAWRDLHLVGRALTVRSGKGAKTRTVPLSASLVATLMPGAPQTGAGATTPSPIAASEYPYRTRLAVLCRRLEIPCRGLHAPRHICGTRLVAETNGNLEDAARHLGHASLETTRIYATWSNTTLRKTVGAW